MQFKIILIYVLCYFGLFASSLIFVSLFDNRKNMGNPKPKAYPFVSIIIPAWNGGSHIRSTIKSALKLKYPKNKIEIIVVDDGSTDDTYRKACEFSKYGVRAFSI